MLTRYLSLAYSVNFTPRSSRGRVVANVTLIDKAHLDRALGVLRSLNDKLLLAPYFKIIDEEETY
ncbi:MAG: DUF128 domain-containing protein [Candidatus Brockarchaeota archaeon]|nr:DUF128 domain-containing protein [Candidatus Brockarchaeota archaeon]MBO3808766.1 DUF128 domain-containing protein [Candidatus Brockarchaeota archaeon]